MDARQPRRRSGGLRPTVGGHAKEAEKPGSRREHGAVDARSEEKFIGNVERLIDPMAVSNLLCFQSLKRLLPAFLLKRLLRSASRKSPHIGFVIEPYSLFLFFKLKDLEAAASLLPDRYELAKTRVFADDEPDHYLGIGNLSTRASTFWGNRQESYLIAKDLRTGLLSWIFIGILSDTVIALPSKGIADPNSRNAIFTTTSKGEILLDFREDRTGRRLRLRGSLRGGTMRELDRPIWLMGNTSIGHSRDLAGGDDEPFAVIFDPAEVEQGLDIPPSDIRIEENTLFPGLAEPELSKAVCFPFAQHYIADSPGRHTFVKDRGDLISHYNRLADSENLTTFSARTIVVQLAIGTAASLLVAALLVLVL
jgi:hypothetical protein